MTEFLLDTNVLSELERLRPAPLVARFIRGTSLNSLFLSDVVIAEIRFGIETTSNAVRREKLVAWLETLVRPMFAGRILAVTEAILLRWRLLIEDGRRRGYTFPQPDLLIAATAVHYRLVIVTRDVEPFERAGATVFNPWEPSS